jgi:hypothetical protein
MTIFDSIEPGLERFGALTKAADQEKLSKFIDMNYKKFCDIFRMGSYMKNVEWMMRHHLASKKIALSAIFYTQAVYMLKRNMKNLSFYASYYAYFNALSSNLILSPLLDVHNISHSGLVEKIDNLFVRRGVLPPATLELLGDLRFARELYSYHLPLSGRGQGNEEEALNAEHLFERLTQLLPCALQAANMLSYLSYGAYERKGTGTLDEYEKYQNQVDTLFDAIVGRDDSERKRRHFDDGDYYQLGSYLAKFKRPMPIGWLIHDWTMDEVEAGWNDSEEESGYLIESANQYLSTVLESR